MKNKTKYRSVNIFVLKNKKNVIYYKVIVNISAFNMGSSKNIVDNEIRTRSNSDDLKNKVSVDFSDCKDFKKSNDKTNDNKTNKNETTPEINPKDQEEIKEDLEKKVKEEEDKDLIKKETAKATGKPISEVTEDDVKNFVDKCLGDNKFLGYSEGKGDTNTNKMAAQLTTAIFRRLAGTGLGMLILPLNPLLAIAIITITNTPTAVSKQLKKHVANKTYSLIPLDKVPNITEKIADYAEKTTDRVKNRCNSMNNAIKKINSDISSSTSKSHTEKITENKDNKNDKAPSLAK